MSLHVSSYSSSKYSSALQPNISKSCRQCCKKGQYNHVDNNILVLSRIQKEMYYYLMIFSSLFVSWIGVKIHSNFKGLTKDYLVEFLDLGGWDGPEVIQRGHSVTVGLPRLLLPLLDLLRLIFEALTLKFFLVTKHAMSCRHLFRTVPGGCRVLVKDFEPDVSRIEHFDQH